MNRNIRKSIVMALALALALPLAANDWPDKVKKQDYEKTYTETFQVDGDGEVRLANRYGEITVETWDRNEVKIDVRVKVSASDQEDANRTFDRIEISFTGGANSATAVTNIGTRKNKNKGLIKSIIDGEWPSFSGGNNSNDFKVYYRVKMPASASLETEAKYCNVNLPDLSGNTDLSVGYGNLVAGDLTGRNEISVSYGSARVDELGENSTFRVRYCDGNEIREANDLRYDGRYSETRIGPVRGRLALNAGYEEVEVESANELRLAGNYNDLEVESVGSVYLDGNYCDILVGEVLKEIEVDASYGDLEIERLRTGFERVYIRVNYIDVELDVDSDAGYDLELRTRYGGISYDSGRANVSVKKSGSTKSVVGSMPGKGSGTIDISTSYGDIEIE